MLWSRWLINHWLFGGMRSSNLSARVFLHVDISFADYRGAFPVIVVDIVLSDDEDDTDPARLPWWTDPIGRAGPSTGLVLAADDAGDTGKTSAKANNPALIVVGAPGPNKPPATDQASTELALGPLRRKCLRIAAKQSNWGRCAA
jgi:hypothetical protein